MPLKLIFFAFKVLKLNTGWILKTDPSFNVILLHELLHYPNIFTFIFFIIMLVFISRLLLIIVRFTNKIFSRLFIQVPVRLLYYCWSVVCKVSGSCCNKMFWTWCATFNLAFKLSFPFIFCLGIHCSVVAVCVSVYFPSIYVNEVCP